MRRLCLLLAGLAASLSLTRVASDERGAPSNSPVPLRANATPAPFVPNLGQWTHPAHFVFASGATTLFAEGRGWTLLLRGSASDAAVRMTFEGAARHPDLRGENALRGNHNYFLGNDPGRWRTHVPLYASVLYRGLYPGIDLRLREAARHPEYDLLLQPGIDLDSVRVRVEGASDLHLADDGSLVIDTAAGPLTQPPPTTYELALSGERNRVACSFVILGKDRFGFSAPARDPALELLLDPGLVFSTYLGSTGGDQGEALACDQRTGHLVVAGTAPGPYYPTTPGALKANSADDGFVTVLDTTRQGTEQLVYSTYLGGTRKETVNDVSVDDRGVLTLAGASESADFPVSAGAWSAGNRGLKDAYVARIDPSLSGAAQLAYATLIGGSARDEAIGVGTHGDGVITVTGDTKSADFPTTPGALGGAAGKGDVFVARFDPDLTGPAQLAYSSHLAGDNTDRVMGFDVDADGIVTVAGATSSEDFPITPGSLKPTYFGGQADGFVTRLDLDQPPAGQLLYSTYLGGVSRDEIWGLSVHPSSGLIAVSGRTLSPDFPTFHNSYDFQPNGLSDAFVCLLVPHPIGAAQLVYSTYLGGSRYDVATAVKLHSDYSLTLIGNTRSNNFPTTSGSVSSRLQGNQLKDDIFVARLDVRRPVPSQLVYSTLLGGQLADLAAAVHVHDSGAVTVVGDSRSPDYPVTPGAIASSRNGDRDAFVSTFDMLPLGVTRYGNGVPGCRGSHAISTSSMPAVGNTGFSVLLRSGPARRSGVVFASSSGRTVPLSLQGLEIWIELAVAPVISFPIMSDHVGAAELALPIPPDQRVTGLDMFVQCIWANGAGGPACPPLGLSSTPALHIRIQP